MIDIGELVKFKNFKIKFGFFRFFKINLESIKNIFKKKFLKLFSLL